LRCSLLSPGTALGGPWLHPLRPGACDGRPLNALLQTLLHHDAPAGPPISKPSTRNLFFVRPRHEFSGSGGAVTRLRQPARACSQDARQQLTQRHLKVVGWVAGPHNGQLKERAGVCPERCEGGQCLGFPALVQGLSSGCGAPRRPLAGPHRREQSQERQSAAADPLANFHAEDDQVAAPSLPQFRVSPVFTVDSVVQGEAWRGPVYGQPVAGAGRPGGLASRLWHPPRFEALAKWGGHWRRWSVQVAVAKAHVRCHSGAHLLANACCCSLS